MKGLLGIVERTFILGSVAWRGLGRLSNCKLILEVLYLFKDAEVLGNLNLETKGSGCKSSGVRIERQ